MAQPYCTGPVDLWVGIGGGVGVDGGQGSPVFLGHGERGPRISLKHAWEPVFNDLSGSQIPFDYMYEGTEALIFVDLTRWNEEVFQEITNIFNNVNRSTPGTETGFDLAGSRGTLVNTEGYGVKLWLHFPYSVKPAMDTLVSGYRFASTILEGPDDRDPLGTSPNKIRCAWHAISLFDAQSGAFLLYDYDMTSLGAIN